MGKGGVTFQLHFYVTGFGKGGGVTNQLHFYVTGFWERGGGYVSVTFDHFQPFLGLSQKFQKNRKTLNFFRSFRELVFSKSWRAARARKDRARIVGTYALKTPRMSGKGVLVSFFWQFQPIKIVFFTFFIIFLIKKVKILGTRVFKNQK